MESELKQRATIVKNLIKEFLLWLLTPLNKRLGFVKSGNANSKDNLLDNFWTTLVKIGFKPLHIVDVGANHGTWTRVALKYFPKANFTLLEPQARMRESITDLLERNRKISFNAVGAGSISGTFKFTIVERDDSCSFIYTEEDALALGYEQIDVPIVTLNEFLSVADLPFPDIIKIDAEGLDIEVLKGASTFFGRTEIFIVEAGVVNKSIKNSFLDIIKFMDDKEYRLFEITDINRPLRTQVLWLVELVFVKKNGFIDAKSFISS